MMPPRVLASGPKPCGGNNVSHVQLPIIENAQLKDMQDMLSELEVMKSLQPHPHVVRLIGCCTEKGNRHPF